MLQNPFEYDVTDDNLLKNSGRSNQLQSLQERTSAIKKQSIDSTERSLMILKETEELGKTTAEELLVQREKLERTKHHLDHINASLKLSQRHIDGMKSVFKALKNRIWKKNEASSIVSSQVDKTMQNTNLQRFKEQSKHFEEDSHMSVSNLEYESRSLSNEDSSVKLDENLDKISSSLLCLKNLATDLSSELDSQNTLIERITDIADTADMTTSKQNKDIQKLLKK